MEPAGRKPQQRKTVFTNSRERQRQLSVKAAFSDLRRLLPTHPPDKKLSKSEILRLAIRYINLLDGILHYQDADGQGGEASPAGSSNFIRRYRWDQQRCASDASTSTDDTD